jgi:nucleoside-triphosphatase THEP1
MTTSPRGPDPGETKAKRRGSPPGPRPEKLTILVTGGPGAGKTSFLLRLHATTRRWWHGCGFVAAASSRGPEPNAPAASYRLVAIGRTREWPWAARRPDGGFEFHGASAAAATDVVRPQLEAGEADICFLDEVGRLELNGQGVAGAFRLALSSSCPIVVAAVKKTVLPEVVTAFELAEPVVIDLDKVGAGPALRDARRRIAAGDAERVGAFAGIAGAVEVGLGSALHAYRVPLKGHALAYLQNVMLIAFGKALRGRGLVRISLLSAMLKAFSPAGSTLRPMAYIFLQGAAFALPVRLLGWSLGPVLLGSVLMAWVTLAVSLAADYVTFGRSIFDAFSGAIASAGGWLGVAGPTLLQVLGALFVLKALVALALGTAAYLGDALPLVGRLGRRGLPHALGSADHDAVRRRRPAVVALRSLLRPRFLCAFLFSALLLLFFANLSTRDFWTVVARGLCLSYLGLLLSHRVDVRAVGGWLDRRAGLGLAKSLPTALDVLTRGRRDRSDRTRSSEGSP